MCLQLPPLPAPIGGAARGPQAPDGRVFPDLEDARLRTAITRASKATGTLSVTVLPALESPPQSHWEAEE
jgi:hypothetical protein